MVTQIASTDRFQCRESDQTLLIELGKLHKNDQLHDVILLCDGVEIPAHKIVLAASSVCFNGMLTDELRESGSSRIEMQGLHALELQLLIDFLYTGKISLNEDNAQAVFRAADLLQLWSVRTACHDFLRTLISPDNCIGIHKLAEFYKCPDLSADAQNMIESQFSKVVQSDDDFLSMNAQELRELLSNEMLNTPEDTIFDALVRWVTHDAENRKKAAKEICSVIRFPLMTLKKLQSVSKSAEKDWCESYVSEAISFHQLPPEEQIRSKPKRRIGTDESMLMVVGGWTDRSSVNSVYGIQANNLCKHHLQSSNESEAQQGDNIKDETITMQTYADIPCSREFFGIAVTCDHVYVIGGQTPWEATEIYNTMDIYNIKENSWQSGPHMANKRISFGIAVLSGHIYVFGGDKGDMPMAEGEMFHTSHKQWSPIKSMTNARFGVQAAVLDGHIYAVGGSNTEFLPCVERYDQITGDWSTIADLTRARCGHSVSDMNGRIYAVGGLRRANLSAEVFTPETGRWEAIGDLNIPRFVSNIIVYDGLLYMIGGADQRARTSIERYDPSTNKWELLSMRLPDDRIRAKIVLLQM